jgi:activator of HSP90 ATPase
MTSKPFISALLQLDKFEAPSPLRIYMEGGEVKAYITFTGSSMTRWRKLEKDKGLVKGWLASVFATVS